MVGYSPWGRKDSSKTEQLKKKKKKFLNKSRSHEGALRLQRLVEEGYYARRMWPPGGAVIGPAPSECQAPLLTLGIPLGLVS